MSDTTTNGIRVQVTTKYLPERSSPRDNEYWFAYFSRISNVDPDGVTMVYSPCMVPTGVFNWQKLL